MTRRGVATLCLCAGLVAGSFAIPAGAANPFPQGTAAYARTTDAILWTRTTKATTVRFSVATDRAMDRVVKRGRTNAIASNNFTVKPRVANLRPNRRYFYRFTTRAGASPVGTFETLPAASSTAPLKFSMSGDSDVLWTDPPDGPQSRPFAVLDRIRETAPDFFIYLGDTIYSDSETEAPPALTLQEKWAKYRANRTPAAKSMLKSLSVWAGWDDHEVINDFDGAVLAQEDPALLQAGRDAFNDYWPIEEDTYYRDVRVGANSHFFFLDERSYRSQSPDEADSPCRDAEGDLDLAPTMPQGDRNALGLPPTDPACLAHIFDPTRTMLGSEQLSWLQQGLLESDAKWKFIVNEVVITQAYVLPYDRWEGYHAERDALLSFIRDNNIKNVVFLTADIHANIGSRVYVSKADDDLPVAYEVVAGPIQTCTLECEIDRILGPGTGEDFVTFMTFRGLVDVDCVDINTFGYATVTVPSDAGSIGVQWRDDERAAGGGGKLVEGCDETIQAAP